MGAREEHVKDLLPDYYLGQLPPSEMEVVRSHLAVCQECRAELDEVAGVLDLLPFSVAPVEPPEHVKGRVFARISGDDGGRTRVSRRSALLVAFAAFLFVALVGLGWAYRGLYHENQRLEARLHQSQQRGGNLVVVAVRGTGQAPSSAGTAVIDAANGGVVLDVYNVPSLPQKLAYRVWLIREGGRAVSLGTMHAGRDGTGRMTGEIPVPVGELRAIDVTAQPPGTKEMEGPVYLHASL